MVLNALPHIGPVNASRLSNHFGHEPVACFQASKAELTRLPGIGEKTANALLNWEEHFDLSRELTYLKKASAEFIDWKDERYPESLLEIYDPPIGFYAKGLKGLKNGQSRIAIVGSRRTTLYGLRVAKEFGRRLAGMGICIVSGMARGVDTAAHEGALEADGETIAVLGNGIDIVYPSENLELYRKIAERGSVISEFTFGRRADRQTFPMRNRIVSGLCSGVIVVESDVNGGSMITAKMAADQGRQVYAIPGRIDQASSRGCHQLIREGAVLVTCVEDILEDLRYQMGQMAFDLASDDVTSSEKSGASKKVEVELSDFERTVLELLSGGEKMTLDDLSDRLSEPIHMVSSQLMAMELKKLVIKQMDGTFESV